MNSLLLTDGYKLSHNKMYPDGTTLVYSNLTARSDKHAHKQTQGEGVIVFGVQMALQMIHEHFEKNFFSRPSEEVIGEMKREIELYSGLEYDVSHFQALHDLGYLPIEVMALEEGTLCPIKVPMLTIHNVGDEFFWVTNYLETILSNILWKPITSATIARAFRKTLNHYAMKTVGNTDGVSYQAHDFSMRGMDSIDAAISSGLGHLTFFTGSDSLPALNGARKYYGAEGYIAGGVPASEHSVMSAGSKETELETYKRLLKLYPKGFLSVVSDTYDLWNVITNILPQLKEEIIGRDGRLVIRPDCYDDNTEVLTPQGFKYFKDLEDEDLVAEVLDDDTYHFVRPLKIINEYYDGDMYHFKDHHGKVDLLVTPNHRMVYKQKNEMTGEAKTVVKEAEDMRNRGNYLNYFLRSAKSLNRGLKLSPFERLKIAFQADGSFVTGSSKKIRFSFKKKRKTNRLLNIVKDLGYETKVYNLKSGHKEIHISCESTEFTKDFSWVEISNLCSNWSQDFLEELKHWDSSIRSKTRFKYDTTNKSCVEIVQIVALSAGKGVYVSKAEDRRKEHFSDVYSAYIMDSNIAGGQSWTKTKEKYSGTIHCVQVPSGKLLVRRNKSVMVCGNSGDPADILCGTSGKYRDISEHFQKGEVLPEHFEDYLLQEVVDITPHGEYGVEEYSQIYRVRGVLYKATIHNLSWNRHDKQYYYLDMFEASEITVEEVEELPEHKGVIQLLWEIFGGTVNEKGYKVLDPHIGAIYGDSITLDKADEIFRRLEQNGFASSNVVIGVGGYMYQYNTRDSYGFALKCTYIESYGVGKEVFKDPITDDGLKKSAKGLVRVVKKGGVLTLEDQVTWKDVYSHDNELRVVYSGGSFIRKTNFETVREKALQSLS